MLSAAEILKKGVFFPALFSSLCLLPADINVDFDDDIFSNINGAVMRVGEASKGDFGIFADVLYMDIEMEDPTPGTLFTALSSQTKPWIISAGGFYRVYEEEGQFMDLLGAVCV